MKKESKIIIGVLVAAVVLMFFGVLSLRVGPVKLGGGVPGTQVTLASTTQFSVAKDTVIQIAATSSCIARIITTGTAGVGLEFMDRPLVGNAGQWQAASTTVAYEASIYGCGVTRARADVATVITVKETRDPR